MEASGDFLDEQFNPVSCRQPEVLVNPKKDPFFEDFPEFFSTLFQCFCICINTRALRNFSIAAAIIRQNLVFCMARCRLNVFH
jgi:hypothetical protein